jgi:hypothetical protein
MGLRRVGGEKLNVGKQKIGVKIFKQLVIYQKKKIKV